MLNKFFFPILLYHSNFKKVPQELSKNIHNVTPENLYKQLNWLKYNFDIKTVDEILSSEKKIQGSFAITFDDGYYTIFKEALPILKSLKMPFTIFLNSKIKSNLFWRDGIRYIIANNLVDKFIESNKNFCNNNKITTSNFYKSSKSRDVNSANISNLINLFLNKELPMQNENHFLIKKADLNDKFFNSPLITVGNHTDNHYVLSSLQKHEQLHEIANCKKFLEKNFKKEKISKVFSIPFGGYQTFNNDTIEVLEELGYKGMLTSCYRLNLQKKYIGKNKSMIMDRISPHDDFKKFQKQFVKSCLKTIAYFN